MRKNLKLFICLFAGLLIVLSSVAVASDDSNPKYKKGFYLFISGGWNFALDFNMCSLETIPEYIRNVPRHPDDGGGFTNIAPIEDSKLSYSPFSLNLINGSAGIGCKFELFDLMLGGNVDWCLFTSGPIKKRNYTNASGTETRGYGAALTYYRLNKGSAHKWNAFTPGLFLRLSRKISTESDFSLFVEYSLDFYNLHLETGWDRYNNLEIREIYKLADINKRTIKIGFFVDIDSDLEFFIGYVMPDSRLTSIGKMAGLKIGPYITIGVGIKANFRLF